MKVFNETYYEVTEPDGGGMFDRSIAKFSTELEAEKYKSTLNQSWPKNVRKGNISVVIYDTCQELLDSSSKKKALKEQIKALQSELDKL